MGATHANMTTQAFGAEVRQWIKTARHPRFKQPYTSMIYAPMLELLDYLRGNGFKTYIVSGGEVEFMRAWAQDVYGIPPEQVIGTTFVTEFQMQDGKPVLMRTPKLDFNDDGPGKPVAINKFIGRQPFSPSAIRTATCRCCNGRRPAAASVSWAWCITPMPGASGLMTGTPGSAGWTVRWMKRSNRVG